MTIKLVRLCEVCGKPATCGVRDLKKRNNYKTGFIEMKPHGLPHYFCDKHQRESQEIDMTISPLHSFLFDDKEW